MKPIGGEIAFKKSPYKSFFTDSGRSSIKLFFRSFDYGHKKVLLPNFFCDVIEQVLNQENIEYEFYNINPDLSLNPNEINNKNFDILYVINYFGTILSLKNVDLQNKILIEDNVFFINFNNHHNAKKWFSFNSYRKISQLTDGSLIKTNLPINESIIQPKNSKFVKYKAQASILKHEFLTKNLFNENEYLSLFKKGENEIDSQNKIYSISSNSLYKLFNIDFKKENEITKKRFNELKKVIEFNGNTPTYYSFFIFKYDAKQDFIKLMQQHQVFLPHFWPKTSQNNKLYDSLIAIPLFSNYSDKEFDFVTELLLKHLKNEPHK